MRPSYQSKQQTWSFWYSWATTPGPNHLDHQCSILETPRWRKTITLITDIKPVLNWRTPLPSLLGSKFWANEYACSHTGKEKRRSKYNSSGTTTSKQESRDHERLRVTPTSSFRVSKKYHERISSIKHNHREHQVQQITYYVSEISSKLCRVKENELPALPHNNFSSRLLYMLVSIDKEAYRNLNPHEVCLKEGV